MPISDDDRATLSAYLDGELDEAAFVGGFLRDAFWAPMVGNKHP